MNAIDENVLLEEKQSISIDIEAEIKNQLFERLGKPKGLTHLGLRNVYGNSWRVTIYCEVSAANYLGIKTEITDCFFLKISPEGGIISSDPMIEKKY
jgi:hypothetical protein